MPLLLWWAIEAKADADRDAVLDPLRRQGLLGPAAGAASTCSSGLMRRYAATGQRKDLLTCAKLLELAPTKEHAGKLMAGLEAAYEGRDARQPAGGTGRRDGQSRRGFADAPPAARRRRRGRRGPGADRRRKGRRHASASSSSRIFGTHQSADLRAGAAQGRRRNRATTLCAAPRLARCNRTATPEIGSSGRRRSTRTLPDQVREVAQSLLASRQSWARSVADRDRRRANRQANRHRADGPQAAAARVAEDRRAVQEALGRTVRPVRRMSCGRKSRS